MWYVNVLQYGLLDGRSVRLALEVDNKNTRRKRGSVYLVLHFIHLTSVWQRRYRLPFLLNGFEIFYVSVPLLLASVL